MCHLTTTWLLGNANLLAGFLGIVGSLLLAVPTFLGADLREETLRIEEMRARLQEPELLDPLMVHAIDRSLAFLRRERHWMRAGALCLVVSFVLMTFDTFCKN